MNKKVYVSGHKVPDTDSIASAISYAYLVNSLGKYDAKAVRLAYRRGCIFIRSD